MRYLALILFTLIAIPSQILAQTNLQELISQNKVTGAQLTWTNGSKIINQQAGFANISEKLKVDVNTIFQAASLSKVIVAYICLGLVEQQKIDLDRPLSKYYSYKRLSNDSLGQEITARMVLQHTTGLPNWAENPMKKTWSTSKLQTSFKPGTKWKYAGEGFVFLQLVIQQILQKDLQQIADSLVFKRLGMKSSSFTQTEEMQDKIAFGYNSKDETAESTNFFLPNGAFSLTTTTTDYSLFLQSFSAKYLKIATSSSVSVVSTSNEKKFEKSIFWGLGVGMQKNELGSCIWHWGDNGSFKTFFMAYPDRKQMLVCFFNHENGLKLAHAILNSTFGNATWPVLEWLAY